MIRHRKVISISELQLHWKCNMLKIIKCRFVFPVPGTYAKAAKVGQTGEEGEDLLMEEPEGGKTDNSKLLCPFAAHGECWYGDNCEYLHGDICDFCGLAVLYPGDHEQQDIHKKVRLGRITLLDLFCW